MSTLNAPLANALDHGVAFAGMVDIDKSLFIMLGLFLVFAILLHVLVMKPLIAAQEARHAGTGGAREGANQLDLAVAERKRDYEQRLSAAKKDAVRVREELKDAATATAASRIAGARAEADSRHATSLAALTEATVAARRELAGQADGLSDAVVSKMIGSK
jgi:F-type H+-transporting ATPase subunit b